MNHEIKHKGDKHEFALYVPSLASLIQPIRVGQDFVLSDEHICNRIKTILRLQVGELCFLFDSTVVVSSTLAEFMGKKQIRCTLNEKKIPRPFAPPITFLLPLLKRDDFELALYSLVEVGVTTIQLLFSHKSRSAWDKKDLDRAQRIVIAAAEQSKNFAFPVIKEPVSLSVGAAFPAQSKFFFDPAGEQFFEVMNRMRKNRQENILALIGPEGDLTPQEKEIVKSAGFTFCSLTPTVLRSAQAAALSAGLLRSLLR